MSVFIPPRPIAAPPAARYPDEQGGAVKAGPIGPGAGVLMTEWLMPIILPGDVQKKAARALALGDEVPYVRMAERAISSSVGGSPIPGIPSATWHLEDPDGKTIDETYPEGYAVEAFRLLESPFQNLDVTSPIRTRRQLWEVTSRHMGLAGYGFWVLDGMDLLGVPRSVLYVRPDRIIPDVDDRGTLKQWLLDPKPGPGGKAAGVPLGVNEVVQFQLQAPSAGYLPAGLIESAIMKVQLAGAIDRHFATLLSGGGRLSGIISPKTGAIEDDGVYAQMVRDWRNITEQPESGKRVQIVRGPIEFTRTVATTVEMALVDFLKQNEADLLTVWGVPLSQLGGYTPAGLNSGDVRKYDRQAMWENAVIPRLSEIGETIQTQILSRWVPLLGWAPRLVIEVPPLEDDSPRYDKIMKAQFIALTNDERRDLIGKGPMDDPALGDQILMPNTLVPIDDLAALKMIPPSGAPSGPAGGPTIQQTAAARAAALGGGTAAVGDAGKAKADVSLAVVAALRKQWPGSALASIPKGNWKFVPDYPLDKIDYARRPVARNPKIVQGVEAALAVGAPIDPVVLVKTKRIGGSSGKPTEPIDGWHRLLAAEHAGLKTVPAYIGKGDDAWTTALIKIDDALPTPPDSAGPAGPEAPRGKADLRSSITGLRQTLEQTMTGPLRASVTLALEGLKRDVVARVRTKYDHIKERGTADFSAWWDGASHDRAMTSALAPVMTSVAETVDDHIRAILPVAGKAAALAAVGGPPARAAVQHVLTKGAARVTKINEYTRDELRKVIDDGLEAGADPAGLGDLIEGWFGWDEYRAERIASTELMFAYNAAATSTYGDLGVTQVEAIDGTGDAECAARNGQIFDLGDAETIEDHPNGTLDWVPIVDTMVTEEAA